jgi:hypothetical protein
MGRHVQLHTTAMTVWAGARPRTAGFLRASPCARLNALCASLSLNAKPLSQSLVRKAAAQNRRLFARDPPSKEHTVSNRGPSGLAKCRAGAVWDRFRAVDDARCSYESDAGVLDDPESPISLKPPLSPPPKKRQRLRQQHQYRRQAADFVCWNAIAHFERLSQHSAPHLSFLRGRLGS